MLKEKTLTPENKKQIETALKELKEKINVICDLTTCQNCPLLYGCDDLSNPCIAFIIDLNIKTYEIKNKT